jgi:hypothetical protein
MVALAGRPSIENDTRTRETKGCGIVPDIVVIRYSLENKILDPWAPGVLTRRSNGSHFLELFLCICRLFGSLFSFLVGFFSPFRLFAANFLFVPPIHCLPHVSFCSSLPLFVPLDGEKGGFVSGQAMMLLSVCPVFMC